MKTVDLSKVSNDECWDIQLNGTKYCKNCKWQELTACKGKNIRKTGFNNLGHKIGENGIIDISD